MIAVWSLLKSRPDLAVPTAIGTAVMAYRAGAHPLAALGGGVLSAIIATGMYRWWRE